MDRTYAPIRVASWGMFRNATLVDAGYLDCQQEWKVSWKSLVFGWGGEKLKVDQAREQTKSHSTGCSGFEKNEKKSSKNKKYISFCIFVTLYNLLILVFFLNTYSCVLWELLNIFTWCILLADIPLESPDSHWKYRESDDQMLQTGGVGCLLRRGDECSYSQVSRVQGDYRRYCYPWLRGGVEESCPKAGTHIRYDTSLFLSSTSIRQSIILHKKILCNIIE